MNYKAILFDLDGTLLDSVQMIVDVMSEALKSMGIDVDDVALRHAIGLPLTVQARHFAHGREQEFSNTYRDIYIRELSKEAQLFPGSIEMLSTLRSQGYLTGVVTSKTARGAARAIETTGIASMFDCVITADDVTHYKPAPEPLIKAMDKLGVTAEESLYVGDSAFDVDMARSAGARVVAISWGARTHEELELIGPDTVVDNWTQFLAMLNT